MKGTLKGVASGIMPLAGPMLLSVLPLTDGGKVKVN